MNSVELIGIVRGIRSDELNNQYLVLEVNRPYLDNELSFIADTFKIYKWGIVNFGVFTNIFEGSQIAIRGHLVKEKDETIIIAEYVKVLYYPKNVVVKGD